MPPEAAFIIGLMLGTAATLLIQAFGRRKVRQALAAANPDFAHEAGVRDGGRLVELDALRQRLAVLERITIDPAVRTAREIEQLRIQAD